VDNYFTIVVESEESEWDIAYVSAVGPSGTTPVHRQKVRRKDFIEDVVRISQPLGCAAPQEDWLKFIDKRMANDGCVRFEMDADPAGGHLTIQEIINKHLA
jgi:hypothetical protein